MYKSGYVVSVRQGSQTLEDQSGKVILPFNEEYELRLRNKNGKDCVAFIYIDGKVVVKNGLILPAHSFIDLERYVEDLNKGSRFKFVPISDRRVEDKSEPENGIIEVRFHEEKERIQPASVIHHFEHHHCHSSYCWSCRRMHCSCCPCTRWYKFNEWHDSPVYGEKVSYSASCDSGALSINNASNAFLGATTTGFASSGSIPTSANANVNLCSAGATVEGSTSHQRFGERSMDYQSDAKAIIILKLVGEHVPGREKKEKGFCPECGAARTGKFCSSCGEKLQ